MIRDSRSTVLDCPMDADFSRKEPAPEWRGIGPLPGRALIRMAIRPQTQGGVLLPDRTQHVCDIGLIVAGGGGDYRRGEWVVLRPYTGMVLDLEHRLVGAGADILDWVIPAYWTPFGPVPAPGWHWAEPEPCGPILTPNPARWRYSGALAGVDGDWVKSHRPPWDPAWGFSCCLAVAEGRPSPSYLVRRG